MFKKLINLVFGNDGGNGRVSVNNIKSIFSKSDGDLYLSFESLDYFSGIQLSFAADNDFSVELSSKTEYDVCFLLKGDFLV